MFSMESDDRCFVAVSLLRRGSFYSNYNNLMMVQESLILLIGERIDSIDEYSRSWKVMTEKLIHGDLGLMRIPS